MDNELLTCYHHFKKMVEYQYLFVLGKKKKEYVVEISIRWENFIHLTGIHHLKDIPELKAHHTIIRKKIARKDITMATLCKSEFFSTHSLDIEYRIKYLARLEEFFFSDNLVFEYLGRSNPQSFIDCDWMLIGFVNNEKCYMFIKKDKKSSTQSQHKSRSTYFMLSFFPERKITYGKYAVNVSILLKQCMHLPSGRTNILHLHPYYDISKLEKLE